MENKTDVIFRMFKGECIAIFPGECGTNDPNTCMSYMHVGQHGACVPSLVIGKSTLATFTEYRSLYHELMLIGYELRVVKVCSSRYRGIRQAKLNGIK